VVNRLGQTAKAFPDQRRLLEAEGVVFRPDGSVDLKIFGWTGLSDP
jgi:methylated-DNA-protein-cysteine methyltransferase-like protein